MASSPLSLRRVLLFPVFLAAGALGQRPGGGGGGGGGGNNDDDNDNDNQSSSSAAPPPAAPAQSSSSTTATRPPAIQTTTSSSTRTTSQSIPTDLPGLSSTTTFAINTGMPSLTGTTETEVPTYAIGIPPTRNAPFMNHSTLPEGTVFIAVGAILGAFGLAILIWRGIVACLLHRSVERAARAQHVANNTDKTAVFPAPPAPFYKYLERDSSAASLNGAGAAGRGVRRTHRGPTPSATPSQTNLFFSPTAPGASGMAGGSNRDSARFLPSGFYAAASPIPGGGGGHAQGNSISMSTLRPASRGRTGMGPSPPDSPSLGPRVASRNFSTSSINLNRPPSAGARAPSAYLDDLLDERPGDFPPQGGFPSSGSPGGASGGSGNGSPNRRY